MQRSLKPTLLSANEAHTVTAKKSPLYRNLTMAILTAGMLSLTGCQSIKNIASGGEKDAIQAADKSEAAYYQEAIQSIQDRDYLDASAELAEMRTFYPTGRYAQQGLLDLMYSQYESKEYELAATSAEQFIRLYPNNVQVDYAYYVRGVANMQAGNSVLLNLAKLKQAHRDTAYLRLAFSNFLELITRYPNSSYAPDAAQRMNYIYNQFAESEIDVARWYIDRQAYVAAANRAKWVFQYYPLSPQVPESIAILAYTNEKLGLDDLAKQYKTLLRLNYPDMLTRSGDVKLKANRSGALGLLNTVTFGVLGRADEDKSDSSQFTTSGDYIGATKQQQIISRAAELNLPGQTSTTPSSQAEMPSFNGNVRSGISLGLGLPEQDAENINDQGSPTATAISVKDSPRAMYPETNPVRQTTPAVGSGSTDIMLPIPRDNTGTVAPGAVIPGAPPVNNDSGIDVPVPPNQPGTTSVPLVP